METINHSAAVARYNRDAQSALMACSVKLCHAAASGLHRQAPGKAGDWRSAIVQGQRKGRANFDAALQGLDCSAAREALRVHHGAFVSALKGLRPVRGEAVDVYQARQLANAEAVKGAWMSFQAAQAAAETVALAN